MQTLKQVAEQVPVEYGRPQDSASSVFMENFGKFERIGSSYSIRFYRSGRSGPYQHGHSKPKNQPEPDDKQKLLIDLVRRLGKNPKYLGRPGQYLEFYRNLSDLDRDSVLLFTLSYERWIPGTPLINNPDASWLIQHLNWFYTPTIQTYGTELVPSARASTVATSSSSVDTRNTDSRSGAGPQAVGSFVQPQGAGLPTTPILPSKHDLAKKITKGPFDESRRFRTDKQLLDYVERLKKDGHAHGRCLDYYTKMLPKIDQQRQG